VGYFVLGYNVFVHPTGGVKMKYFFDLVLRPFIIENRYEIICEIGAKNGDNTDKLLKIDSVDLTIIDTCLSAGLYAKYGSNKRVKILKGLSVEWLSKTTGKFDCILIDGDHNWYTVLNELRIIEENDLLKAGGTIFLHDVCWPYGRRDLYYNPESIPVEFRHPYAKKGIECGKSELSETAAYNNHLNNAIYEGGPRNGVLTAIEDFLSEYGRRYTFFYFKKGSGLGFLIKNKGIGTGILSIKWLILVKFYEVTDKIGNILTRFSKKMVHYSY
jgi:hypothetical protein